MDVATSAPHVAILMWMTNPAHNMIRWVVPSDKIAPFKSVLDALDYATPRSLAEQIAHARRVALVWNQLKALKDCKQAFMVDHGSSFSSVGRAYVLFIDERLLFKNEFMSLLSMWT